MSGQAAAIARVRGLTRFMAVRPMGDPSNMKQVKAYMQEYLRLMVLWSNALHIRYAPFTHLAVKINSSIAIDDDLKKAILENISTHTYVRNTLIGYVLWEMLDKDEISKISSLPSPYEPLIRMYEAGGEFWIENGFLDLYDAAGWVEGVRTDKEYYEGKESFLTELGE
ncbi:MAG: hypothetical protein J0M33_21785 [Anaerolineae bacterium]|nr:hypothetical protein [Anaerolineae bacterium]